MPDDDTDRADGVSETLPYLRRYARALTGSQHSGDVYAAATLETLLFDRDPVPQGMTARLALFRVFHLIWNSAGSPVDASEDWRERAVQDRLDGLTPNSREALLLHSLESFSVDEIATIIGLEPPDTEEMIDIARHEMADRTAGKVLVIEDEAIIAMDLHGIVSSLGHRVTGISRTHRDAVALGLEDRPDLILADIRLADNSSGIDAVGDLVAQVGEIPVIFITAFPEKLLTGQRAEPAFLVAKPYTEDQLRAAISQAMFFSSTDAVTA